MEIKIKLLQLGLKQRDVVAALTEKGLHATEEYVSRAIKNDPEPRFQKIRAEILMYLEEAEAMKEKAGA